MRIGAHVRQDEDPIGYGETLGADVIQMFLTDPQKWDKPPTHPRTDEIRNSPIDVVVHSSYVINVASLNNRLRMRPATPSRSRPRPPPTSVRSGWWSTVATSATERT